MILSKEQIFSLGLFSDFINESQFQPAGFDFSLARAFRYKNAGRVDFDNKERKISDTEEIPFDENGWIFLEKGAYKVMYNEYVKIPKDCVAFCLPRSSMLRSGASMQTALWDPGYEGRSESMLVVFNEHGIYLKKNAKIAQLIFIRMEQGASEGYNGIYKGENKNSKQQ